MMSAVMADNSVPLISPRYKFTISASGAALSAGTPRPSRHQNPSDTHAARVDIPMVGSPMISGTEACGLQVRDPQDKHPPHPQCEALGNNRTEHVRVSARPHIEIPHTVVRMLMHQYRACTLRGNHVGLRRD